MLLVVQLTECDPFTWDAALGLAKGQVGQSGKSVLERSKLTCSCKNAGPSSPAAAGDTKSAAHTEDQEVSKGVERGVSSREKGRDPRGRNGGSNGKFTPIT